MSYADVRTDVRTMEIIVLDYTWKVSFEDITFTALFGLLRSENIKRKISRGEYLEKNIKRRISRGMPGA